MELSLIRQLSQRKQKILAAIVDAYVDSGEPVGSKLLAQQLGVSSATVRNEMASLVDLGLLEQPHTSAGPRPLPTRVPVIYRPFDGHAPAYGRGTPVFRRDFEPERL